MGSWLTEDPPPTANEIARRLKTQHFTHPSKWTKRDRGLLKPLSSSVTAFGLSQRARTIARTEVSRARNAGKVEGMKMAGFTHYKWVSYNDARSRKGHAAMNGQKRKIGKPFKNKETKIEILYPGDPAAPPSETINCRCTVVPVIKSV